MLFKWQPPKEGDSAPQVAAAWVPAPEQTMRACPSRLSSWVLPPSCRSLGRAAQQPHSSHGGRLLIQGSLCVRLC